MAFAAQMICRGRDADRIEVALDATLRDTSANPVDVEIDDISVSGFRMSSSVDLQTGEVITVGLPGLGMERAIVVRRAPGRYGCRFVNLVSEAYLEQLRIGTPETVARFPDAGPLAMPEQEAHPASDDQLPIGIRVAIIMGLGITFWALLLMAIKVIF